MIPLKEPEFIETLEGLRNKYPNSNKFYLRRKAKALYRMRKNGRNKE